MKLKTVLLLSALGAAVAANAQVAGNSVAVYSVTTNAGAATSAANPATVLDFSTAGTAQGSFAVPSTGTTALTNSGSATSEGQLTLSGDGMTLLFGGYRANAGTAAVASTTAAANPRVVGTLSVASGTVNTATTTGTAFSANNLRSVYSFDSTSYYAIGATSGVVGGTLGTGTGATIGTPTLTNLRYVDGFNSNLYFSTGSGTTTRGIFQVDPTTGVQTQILATGATSSPYAFQFLSATSLLVADDTTGTGGLSLYTNSGTGFTLTSTLAANPTRSFAYSNGVVYFTTTATTANALDSVSLTGSTFGTVTTLATAATNSVFRGVAFVPATQAVPEPSAFAAFGLGALALVRRRRKA